MKLVNLFVILMIFSSIATAHLMADKDKFEIELNPDKMTKRSLKLENAGDVPITEIVTTPVAGDAKDLVIITVSEFDKLNPEVEDEEDEEEVDVSVLFIALHDAKPGTYTGVVYFVDNTFPSLPLPVEFKIVIVEQDSYGVNLDIEDAKSASKRVDADTPVTFKLGVRNSGLFRDVISIDVSPLPESWSAILFDHGEAVDLPYELALSPMGTVHKMDLAIMGETPGEDQLIEVKATSLSNPSKNSTAIAEVKTNKEVRRCEINVDLPEQITVNETYTGSINIELGVEENITVTAIAPQHVVVVPQNQVIPVKRKAMGTGNFTLMAAEKGNFTLKFDLVDSNGVPLPKEKMEILAVNATEMILERTNFAIVTGDDVFFKAIVSSYAESMGKKDHTLAVAFLPSGDFEGDELTALKDMPLSTVLILGNESIVPRKAEEFLSEFTNVERIIGEDICETSWLFASKMWASGFEDAILVGTDKMDVLEAYLDAKNRQIPLIICDSNLTEEGMSTIEELKNRDYGLSRILVWGTGIDDSVIEALKNMGLSTKAMSSVEIDYNQAEASDVNLLAEEVA